MNESFDREKNMDEYGEKLKKTKDEIIKNLDELSCTDLMEISYIANDIVNKRLEK